MNERWRIPAHEMRRLDPAFCESDARVLWKDDGGLSIHYGDRWPGCIPVVPMQHRFTRELRSIALQLLWFADRAERADMELAP